MGSPAQNTAPFGATCPLCGAATMVRYADMYGDRYGYPGQFGIRRCVSCGHCDAEADIDALGIADNQLIFRRKPYLETAAQ